MIKQRITSGMISLLIGFSPPFYEPFHDALIKLFPIPLMQEAIIRGLPIVLGLMVFVVWAAIYDSRKMKSEKQILMNTIQNLQSGTNLLVFKFFFFKPFLPFIFDIYDIFNFCVRESHRKICFAVITNPCQYHTAISIMKYIHKNLLFKMTQVDLTIRCTCPASGWQVNSALYTVPLI